MSKNASTAVLAHRDAIMSFTTFCDALKIDGLPADLKDSILKLKSELNEQLVKLPPLDQVPAASEAASSINWLTDALVRMQGYATSHLKQLQSTVASLAGATRQYNELKAQVDSGELVTKAKLNERCEITRQEGFDSRNDEVAGLRKQVVAGLPEIPESILKLKATEFNAAIDDARANLETGKKAGLTLEGKGKTFLKRAIFLKQAEFASEVKDLKESGFLGEGHVNLNGAPETDSDEAPPAATPRSRFRLG